MRITLAGPGEGAELLACSEACCNSLVAVLGHDGVQTVEPDLPEPTWACSWCAWCGNRISLPPDGCVFHAGECPVRWLQTTTPAALVAARAGVLLDDRGWVLLRRVLGSSYLEFGHVDGLWCAEMLRKGAGLDG